MSYPYEVSFEELQADLDIYVDQVVSCLKSDFLILPRGEGFIDYPVFEGGYEALKRTTGGFKSLDPALVTDLVFTMPITFIVLRCVLGFTPPEWAYLTTEETGVAVSQGAARSIDRNIRLAPTSTLPRNGGVTEQRIEAMVLAACSLLADGAPETASDLIHRLQKADTLEGLVSIQALADLGVPYPVLLYERFLGRPFAGHRDSVSELVGDVLESAIEATLCDWGVSFRKTKRAERVVGFDQAPDFIIPSEFNPQVVIEAKITEDDGTARDKITRVQHLQELSLAGQTDGTPKFEVIACIAGRGFRERREDMKKLLLARPGKVFALQNLASLVPHTRIKDFATKTPPPVANPLG